MGVCSLSIDVAMSMAKANWRKKNEIEGWLSSKYPFPHATNNCFEISNLFAFKRWSNFKNEILIHFARKWNNTLCKNIILCNRGQLWKGKLNKVWRKKLKETAIVSFFFALKFQKMLAIVKIISYKSLTHLMLQKWHMKFVYLLSGAL